MYSFVVNLHFEMVNKGELAKKVAEVTLVEQNIKKLKENTVKRAQNLTYSYLISRNPMLCDLRDKATKLHTTIVSFVPKAEQ